MSYSAFPLIDNSELEFACFGDKRLTNRCNILFDSLYNSPHSTIWSASFNHYQAKAAYRFINNSSVSDEPVFDAHLIKIINRLNIGKINTILVPQDTTTINLNNRTKVENLGYFCEQGLGFNVHSAIALTTDGVPLGIVDQYIWTREVSSAKKTRNEIRKMDIHDKESIRWLNTMNSVESKLGSATNIIHLCDREGDIYALFKECGEDKKFVIRVQYNRKTTDNLNIISDIKNTLPAGEISVNIPRDTRKNIGARTANLELRYKKYNIKKTNHSNYIEASIIYVKEKNPPKGVNEIEWFLATNLDIKDYNDAFTYVQYYVQRWKIERFHFVLKSGCKIEEKQGRSIDTLKLGITLFSIISVMILQLLYYGRAIPDSLCSCLFDEKEWKTIFRVANKTKTDPPKCPSMKEIIICLAKMGGFKERKSDKLPGVKCLWIGLTKFHTIMEAIDYIQR